MAETSNKSTGIGIVQHSYTEAWKPNSGAKFSNALTFLEYAHSMGAAGVQIAIKPEEQPNAGRIRERAEELGVYFEGNLTLPKSEAETELFTEQVKAAVAAGATVARAACLMGRRYETFKSLEEFKAFRETSEQALRRAEPILKANKLKLGVENHKDWLIAEQVEILKKLSSEWIGGCVDTGNGLALIEGPFELITALGPLVFTSHLKDMGVQEYEEGFLLSEVPLGDGFLPIAQLVEMLRTANPAVRLNLEMITRDPLKIPCLTEQYWKTFEKPKAARLAFGWKNIKSNPSPSLPRTTGLSPAERLAFEDENVRKSLKWAAEKLKS